MSVHGVNNENAMVTFSKIYYYQSILCWNVLSTPRRGRALSFTLRSCGDKELVTRLAGWSVISECVKSKRLQHYIVVFSPSLSYDNLLKMQLHGLWTGSYCRCKGNSPTACHKTPPWGVTGHKQSKPSSHLLTLTTNPPHTRWDEVRMSTRC